MNVRHELVIIPPHKIPSNELRDPPPHVFTGGVGTSLMLIYAGASTILFGSAPVAWFFVLGFAAYTALIVFAWALISLRPWYCERRRRRTLLARFSNDQLRPLSPEWREAIALAPDHAALPFSLSFTLTTMDDDQLWKRAIDPDDPGERHARDELIRRARADIKMRIKQSRQDASTSAYR